jgi:hypothetical protein
MEEFVMPITGEREAGFWAPGALILSKPVAPDYLIEALGRTPDKRD